MRGSVALWHDPRMSYRVIALILFLFVPALAEAAPDCLAPSRWQSAIQTKKAMPLTQVMRGLASELAGEVVSARLCEGKDGLRYVLTLVDGQGKVIRAEIHAVDGHLVSRR